MSYNNLIRWSALALIVAGILIVFGWVLSTVNLGLRSELKIALGFSSSILLIFGLMGIYGCQIQESGLTGFFGFILAIISNCFILGQNWLIISGMWLGWLGMLSPLFGITGVPGYILLAIGTWQARRLPRGAAILWAAGFTLSIMSSLIVVSGTYINYLAIIGLLIWAIGFIWAGIGMISLKVEPAVIPVNES